MNYKFCPYCGSKFKFIDQYFKCESCGKKTFLNSKPATCAIILDDDKFLITKRSVEPKKGEYDFIGGFLNMGEHPEEGTLRETEEETGLTIRITKQLGIYIEDSYYYQDENVVVLIVVYLAEIVGGRMEPKDDVASLHWFPIENPPKKLAFKWLGLAMIDLQKEYRSLNLK